MLACEFKNLANFGPAEKQMEIIHLGKELANNSKIKYCKVMNSIFFKKKKIRWLMVCNCFKVTVCQIKMFTYLVEIGQNLGNKGCRRRGKQCSR